MNMKTSSFINLMLDGLLVLGTDGFATAVPEANPERDCYFGDTHAVESAWREIYSHEYHQSIDDRLATSDLSWGGLCC
jgi:hypothetical protein